MLLILLYLIKKSPLHVLSADQKFQQKLMLLLSIIEKVNNLIIVGAMANNFFIYKRILKIGKSLVEKNTKEIIQNYLMKKLKKIIVKY